MIRALHRWPGLVALALVTLLALSGAALSVFPAADRLTAAAAGPEQTVADLASLVQKTHPGVEQIRRAPSGRITASWTENDQSGSAVIDPATGTELAQDGPNAVEGWLKNFHRSLFLGDGGRIVMAAGAVALLILSISGVLLVARRAGGWRRWFAPIKGPLAGRLHVEVARIAVAGLMLSSLTALWMTASTFGFIPDTPAAQDPPAVSGATGMALADMPILMQTRVADLRELTFPFAGDANDVFTLKTSAGTGLIDQGTGAVLAWNTPSLAERISETVYMLHTGQGAASLGLVLGLLALGVPLMAVTGLVMWLSARRGRPRIRHNAPAAAAETILLVGSEGGSTWGFAATLHAALSAQGQAVHAAAMSAFAPERYHKARRIIVMAASYGNGEAPSSAKGFLAALQGCAVAPKAPLAVLGFGDKSFTAFCGFAEAVNEAARAKGWRPFMPFATVDRQSPQDFARWGKELGHAMGMDLELHHQPQRPAAVALTLISRRDYGEEVQAPTAILRFALPHVPLVKRMFGAGFGGFAAGDLLGILPEGSMIPRFYSLASGRQDGFIEIAVRKHAGGLCSSQLLALEPGDKVAGFVRPNPGFRPMAGRAPVILIGAGTGLGPLAGFVRANEVRRPMHLFYGMRHPSSDFLYAEELYQWQSEGKLDSLVTATSRASRPHYVQDALWANAAEVARLVASGAQVMVCGGRDMAAGVSQALAQILDPVGLSPLTLKAEGRYVEDVY